jgi:hypothetical protein
LERKPDPEIRNAWLKRFLARYPLSEYPRTGDRVIDVSGAPVSFGICRRYQGRLQWITEPVTVFTNDPRRCGNSRRNPRRA